MSGSAGSAGPGLDAARAEDRLAALRDLAARRPRAPLPADGPQEVNCHVHTIYSFSPYSPAAAAERAQAAGLAAVGIIDHDSMAGAAEMRQAGRILGIATTAGVELRVSAAGTALEGRRINNPDSLGIFYMIVHGVPGRSVPRVRQFLQPLQAAREQRGRLMLDALNGLMRGYGLRTLDWDRDVRARSCADEGGTITERHILAAVARAIVEKTGPGPGLLRFVTDTVGVAVPPRVAGFLGDASSGTILFDLLGVLKSSFMEKVYVQPGPAECVPVQDAVGLAEEVGGIPTYAYLGDVSDSPTGDKKAEQFEDGYLDELMQEVRRLGFRAIAYMPPRNTPAQLRRVQALCTRHGFMEISGVDINSPRQSFNCPELLQPEFAHLISTTWALIAHERLSEAAERYGLFHPSNPLAALSLADRIAAYARLGRGLDPSSDRSAADSPVVASWGRRQ